MGQGLSGYAFRGEIGYGYTPMLYMITDKSLN